MNHYLDIRLLTDPEFPKGQLMSALFCKLHRALGEQQGGIGISFPAVSERNLGDCLRIHGSPENIHRLMALPWLTGMQDLIRCTEIKPVPSHVQYRCVSRVQLDSNPERMRRRLIRRHRISEEEAMRRIPDSAVKLTSLPFVNVRSNHSGHRYRLFIRHGQLKNQPQVGIFSDYGLSTQATIPWF